MSIVRSDKREKVIESFQEIREQIKGLLVQADALQAQMEELEIDLGLSNEKEQAGRDQCMVTHYPANDDTGHPLDECTAECGVESPLADLGESANNNADDNNEDGSDEDDEKDTNEPT